MAVSIMLPGLIWPDRGDLESLYSQVDTSNLNSIIARGKVNVLPYCFSDFLYNIKPQLIGGKEPLNHDLSLAKNIAINYQLADQFADFLFAEPTHLRLNRDTLQISEPELLELDSDEVNSIITSINDYFNNEIKIFPISNTLWLIGLNFKRQDSRFYPLIDIIGENADDFLPHGGEFIRYHALLNELQMLLHNHPVNQHRDLAGFITINSLWLWDKSIDAAIKKRFGKINYLHKFDSDYLKQNILANDNGHLFIFDLLYYPARYRDHYAWLEKTKALNELIINLATQIFASHKQLKILIPLIDQTIEITASSLDKYCLWRPKTSILNIASQFIT